MDEQLIKQLINTLDAQNNTLRNIDNYFRDQDRQSDSPTPRYPTGSYSSTNLTNASNLLGTVFTNTSGQITQYSEKFTDALAGVMPGLGGFTAGSKAAADAGLRLTEASADAALALRQYGYNTEGQILQAEKQAAALNLSLDEFVRFIAQNSTTLALFDGSVSDGVTELINLKNELRSPELEEYYNRLRISGLTLSDLNEEIATFAAFNRMGQLQDDQARRKYFADLVALREAMVGLADITGISADEQQAGAQKFLQSAEFLQARIRYGENDPVIKIASQLGAMGHDTLAKAMVTGMFDPNDPATGMYLTQMPGLTKTAMDAGAMMRAGRGSEVDLAETLKTMTLQIEREGEALVNRFGSVAHIAKPFEGALNSMMGNMAFQNTVLSDPSQIVEAYDRVGQLGVSAESAAMQIIGMKDNFADVSQTIRMGFAGIENTEIFDNILNVMGDAAAATDRLTGIGAAIASGDVTVALSETDLAIKELLAQDPTGNADTIETLKLQQENLSVLQQVSAGTISTETAIKTLQGNLSELGLDEKEISEMNLSSLKATTLNVNIEAIAGSSANLADVFRNPTEEDTPSIGGGAYNRQPDFFDQFVNFLFRRNQTEEVNAAQNETRRRVAMQRNREKQDLITSMFDSAQIQPSTDTLTQLLDSQNTTNSKLDNLVQAITDGSIRQADATRGAAQTVASEARTGNLPNMFARTTGVQVN